MDRNIFATLILIATFLIADIFNAIAEEQYVMIGDSVSIVTNNNKTTEVKTKKTLYKKGKEYPIYIMASNGRCYVKRISAKNRKEYKIYLPESISKQIAEELGYSYTYTKK